MYDRVPKDLKDIDQWVCWKIVSRGGNETKIPVCGDGSPAKSNDPATWAEFRHASEAAERFDGLGFVFAESDPFCGIDLDGCRDVETGVVADWARAIIIELGSYAEVSPSQTGVKIWVRGKWTGSGHKKILKDVPVVNHKTPAIEIYDSLRFFAVTGLQLAGMSEIRDCQEKLDALKDRFWKPLKPPMSEFKSESSVIDRARRYLSKVPPSISGQGGHNAAFYAACILCMGFVLSEDDAFALMSEWNAGCVPPWSEKELRHKVQDANRQSGERGYLRDVRVQDFDRVKVPNYQPSPEPPKATTLRDATMRYVDAVAAGQRKLVETGIGELDHALAGGLDYGELVILAGRPSHGKSAVALQIVHHLTWHKIPVLLISEEMSALALGKRVAQFATEVHQEHWETRIQTLRDDVDKHFHDRAKCLLIESCRTSEAVAAAVRKHVDEDGVKCVVVDYAQLLTSKGANRYEQVTATSLMLRKICSDTGVLLIALCQLSRAVESRESFQPKMSDLKESGQLEQDADVVIFGVWPHRIDGKQDPNEYMFFVGKNRNRAINEHAFQVRFEPGRQRFLDLRVSATPFFEEGVPDFNEMLN